MLDEMTDQELRIALCEDFRLEINGYMTRVTFRHDDYIRLCCYLRVAPYSDFAALDVHHWVQTTFNSDQNWPDGTYLDNSEYVYHTLAEVIRNLRLPPKPKYSDYSDDEIPF